MENNPAEMNDIPENEGYQPRPKKQVWAARAALVFFILFVIYQIVNLAAGGL